MAETILDASSLDTYVQMMFLSLSYAFLGCNLAAKYVTRKVRSTDVQNKAYDFIIVGGGSAGCTLASRLTENQNIHVLLIEAGGEPSGLSQWPGGFLLLQKTDLDWQYETEVGDCCKGLRNETCNWPQGKVLGGGSTINAMLYVRGQPADYDNWESQGNPGWSWDTVEHYFKKLDAFQNTCNGRMFNYTYTPSAPAYPLLKESAQMNGLTTTDASSATGCYISPTTIHDGERMSAARAYIAPVSGRLNLDILLKSEVTKVLFDGTRAYGVEIDVGSGILITVNCTKEVIVSAGSVGSPKLLMLSGVGPAAHLASLGINVVKDLSVGQNLQDHCVFTGSVFRFNATINGTAADAALEYCTERTGAFAELDICNTFTMLNTDHLSRADFSNPNILPNIQYMHLTFVKNDPILLPLYITKTNLPLNAGAALLAENAKYPLVTVLPILLTPQSRGRIELRSTSYKDKPKIFPNYFDHPDDLIAMRKAIIFYQDRMLTTGVWPDRTEFLNFGVGACQNAATIEEYWECNLIHLATTLYHPVGTCKMGPRSDPNAVVDNELRVHDLQSISVIDSSIMPTIVRGNTNIPTIMIAERAVDFIRARYNISVTCECY